MARTTTEVLARARAAIGDPSGVRATNATCLGYVVDGLNIIKGARPDLFIGAFGTSYESIGLGDDIPLDSQYFLAIAMFVGAMIESQDEQSADRARGEMLSRAGGAML